MTEAERSVAGNRPRRGSFLVESALCLTVFVLMLLAIFDISHFLFLHQSLIERTRAALRYGTVNPYDPTAIQNVLLYNSPTQPEGLQPSFNLNRDMIDVARLNAGTSEDRLVVTISRYQFLVLTPLIAGSMRAPPITASLPYEADR
jgi:hypothetical protein